MAVPGNKWGGIKRFCANFHFFIIYVMFRGLGSIWAYVRNIISIATAGGGQEGGGGAEEKGEREVNPLKILWKPLKILWKSRKRTEGEKGLEAI